MKLSKLTEWISWPIHASFYMTFIARMLPHLTIKEAWGLHKCSDWANMMLLGDSDELKYPLFWNCSLAIKVKDRCGDNLRWSNGFRVAKWHLRIRNLVICDRFKERISAGGQLPSRYVSANILELVLFLVRHGYWIAAFGWCLRFSRQPSWHRQWMRSLN